MIFFFHDSLNFFNEVIKFHKSATCLSLVLTNDIFNFLARTREGPVERQISQNISGYWLFEE